MAPEPAVAIERKGCPSGRTRAPAPRRVQSAREIVTGPDAFTDWRSSDGGPRVRPPSPRRCSRRVPSPAAPVTRGGLHLAQHICQFGAGRRADRARREQRRPILVCEEMVSLTINSIWPARTGVLAADQASALARLNHAVSASPEACGGEGSVPTCQPAAICGKCRCLALGRGSEAQFLGWVARRRRETRTDLAPEPLQTPIYRTVAFTRTDPDPRDRS